MRGEKVRRLVDRKRRKEGGKEKVRELTRREVLNRRKERERKTKKRKFI